MPGVKPGAVAVLLVVAAALFAVPGSAEATTGAWGASAFANDAQVDVAPSHAVGPTVSLTRAVSSNGAAVPTDRPVGHIYDSARSLVAARTAPGLADDFADHVVLGKSIGLEDQAAKIGGRHLMGSADWQADVLSAISNPNTRISVALDGLEGAGTAQSRVLAAVQRASSGRGSPLDWGLMQLYQSGRLPTTSFDEGGSAITNPFD